MKTKPFEKMPRTKEKVIDERLKVDVRVKYDIDSDGFHAVALTMVPKDLRSGVLLGRFYLAIEGRSKDGGFGGFGPCSEDERDAPLEMLDYILLTKSRKAKKEIESTMRHPLPKKTSNRTRGDRP